MMIFLSKPMLCISNHFFCDNSVIKRHLKKVPLFCIQRMSTARSMIYCWSFQTFLYTGITFAYLHISGILPSSYDLLKVINNGINIYCSQPNKNDVDTSSGPGAFPFFYASNSRNYFFSRN